ncbi:MAG: dienelactone hydrolase family protein [Chthoniobacterales bacterium]
MKTPLRLLLALALIATSRADISTREVTYPAGDIEAKGLLAIPEGDGKSPGILVVHEWWGINDYARERAKMLAELGYVALAVDMYGDGKTAKHPDDAMAFSKAVMSNLPEATARFEAAMDFLQSQPEVDPDKIGAIGYCFGGGVVLQMAASGIEGLDAVVSFHGSLGAKVPTGVTPSARMLVLTGTADQFVPSEAVDSFEKRMAEADATATVISYPGAKHGFTNPEADEASEEFDLPVGYDQNADRDSWGEMKEFFSAAFESTD